MPYRSNVAVARVLEVRPDAGMVTVGAIVAPLLFVAIYAAMTWICGGAILNPVGITIVAVVSLIVWGVAIHGATTRVRLVIDDRQLYIQWRSLGRVRRQRTLAVDDVIDVAILPHDPTEDANDYLRRIVIGSRDGDVMLMDSYQETSAADEQRCDEVGSFLGVPRGTRTRG